MAAIEPLRLIQFRAGYNLPVHAAVEHGFFARRGLVVEVAYTPGSVYMVESLIAGKFEIAHPSADDVIAEVERGGRGADLFIFMGLHGGLLSLVGAPGTADFDSLRGRELGVDARTTGFVFVLEKLLRSRGLRASDYRLIEVGGWEKRYQALRDGKIAATLLTEPYLGEALAAGAQLLARVEEAAPVYQATCGAARRSWARRNVATLTSYIAAYREATRWCFDPGNRAACLDILARHNGIVGAAARRTLDALLDRERGLYVDAAPNLPGITAALTLRAESGHLSRPAPPPDTYVDLSYYRRAVDPATSAP